MDSNQIIAIATAVSFVVITAKVMYKNVFGDDE